MKTAVDIPDDLVMQAKALAAEQHTTLEALRIDALRQVIARHGRNRAFELRDASVPGQGLQPGVTEGDWESIGDTIHKGRGC